MTTETDPTPPRRPIGVDVLAFFAVVVLVGFLVWRGCLNPEQLPPEDRPLFPVSGMVVIDGEPVPNALVQVAPLGYPVAQGYTDEQGRFQLTTHEEHDGCPNGVHPVAVISFEQTDVPLEYQDLKTTPLTLKVDGPTSDVVLELTWGDEQGPIRGTME
jgi:hypothetical protein